ncbi:MAG: hypothetical protein LBF67_07200 [Prevotellaceae bacterium]|jgi:hypothetical protein|nr:hypothetical protein [Prevotellaceae bacterium]
MKATKQYAALSAIMKAACYFTGALSFLLHSCTAKEETPPVKSKSTLIYMVADNNLDYYAVANVKKMEQGMPEDARGNIFVFIDRNMSGTPSHPYLLQIHRDTASGAVTSGILRAYREQNSCDPQRLRQVIDDVRQHCDGQNSVLSTLVLWSHGTGWLPEGAVFDDNERAASPLSIGLDNTGANENAEAKNKELDIKDLAAAISGLHFELLIMDACFMGSVEVAYELRNNFEYMILSPSEILSTGFPYMDIANDLVSDEVKAEAIAEKFFSYYSHQQNALQSATVTVVDAKQLENLALEMRNTYQKYAVGITDSSPIPTDIISQYDRTLSNYFFDFRQFLAYTFAGTQESHGNILAAWSNALPYYRHTEKMFSALDLSETGGLSIYIPNRYEERIGLHDYYKTLEWAKDSHAAAILFN